MISWEEFFKIFLNSKDVVFLESELNNFYYSIRKSCVIAKHSREAFFRLQELEKNIQWPVLKKMGNPKLDIYKNYAEDPQLVKDFTGLIQEEEKIIKDKGSYTKYREVICGRISLYSRIFKFSLKDRKYVERRAVLYGNALAAKLKKERAARAVKYGLLAVAGIGAGVVATKIYKHLKKNGK
jgi:hypothetical protein